MYEGVCVGVWATASELEFVKEQIHVGLGRFIYLQLYLSPLP